MAIIVEENEKKSNVLGIVGWLVFLIIAAAAVYYLFFAQPELVTIPATGTIGTVAPITQLTLQPATVVQSPAFQALVSSIPLPTPQGPAAVGRSNPFIAP
ncbi:MAG TPA: hypothetical protein VMR99_01630 [Candidatus Paceibacterota bacterium]|nr:hypothetical protein [Candidatus Paceibacterota bacterium]